MTAKTKRFGRKSRTAIPVVDFTVAFEIDGEEVDHLFSARPQITYGDMVGLKRHEKDTEGGVLPYLDRIIRRSLRNDDGVPANWAPVIRDGEFTNPDGTSCPVEDLPKYTAHEAGSSRRRWIALIESEDAVIEFDVVMSLFEWLAGEVGAGRPS